MEWSIIYRFLSLNYVFFFYYDYFFIISYLDLEEISTLPVMYLIGSIAFYSNYNYSNV